MNNPKIKIVLDADVVIHFIKGECLSLLPEILPGYRFVVLDIVFDTELRRNAQTCTQIDNQIRFVGNITVEAWKPNYEMMKEYAFLLQTFGVGESASMVYCKYNPNVLASSNLRDIKFYCEQNNITYLTTMDFLSLAHRKKILNEEECDAFITAVLQQGSKLPVKRLRDYTPRPEIYML